MGGYGSGRRSSKAKLEDGLRLDLNRLLRCGQLRKHSWTSGTLTWSYVGCGEVIATVGYESDLSASDYQWLRLYYTITRYDEKTKMDYKIRLAKTRTNFGGERLWFICPLTGKRSSVLYSVSGSDYFASRSAYNALYRSQCKSPQDRAIDRMWKLKNRLGGEEFWLKPKGMHETTYQRKLQEIFDAEELCDYYLALMMSKYLK